MAQPNQNKSLETDPKEKESYELAYLEKIPYSRLWLHYSQQPGTQPKYPSADEWINQKWHMQTMEYYSAFHKKGILSLATMWMKLENIMLCEICQSEKDKRGMILWLWGI